MPAIATDFGIQEALAELGLKEVNDGTSTGSHYFSGGDVIESYSPVDGKLIGNLNPQERAGLEIGLIT